MNTFLKQVVRFGLLGCGLTAVILVLHAYAYFSLCEAGLRLPDGVDTLVFGHSHAERGVNPTLFSGCMNVAQSNEGYDVNLRKVRVFIASNPRRVKRIIIPVGYHSFLGSHADDADDAGAGEAITNEVWVLEKERRYAFLRYAESHAGVSFHAGLIFSHWLQPTKGTILAMLRYLAGGNRWRNELPFVGGYRRSYSSMLTPQMLSDALAIFANHTDYPLNLGSLKYVSMIVDEGARAGAQVDLVFFPVHPDYQTAVPVAYEQKLKGVLRELAEPHGARFYDFTGFVVDAKCYQDHTHLNGASGFVGGFLIEQVADPC